MKQVVFILMALVAMSGYALFSNGKENKTPEKAIEQTLLAQVNDFSAFLKDKLQPAAESNSPNKQQLQQLFLQARLRYKKLEWAAEYFDAATTRAVNGAPVPEIEMGSRQLFEPAGLQVVEGLLYPQYDTAKQKELLKYIKDLQLRCNKYRTYFSNIDIFDWQVFDAAKLQVFRLMSLGIAGFDDPLTTSNNMAENAVSLESVQKALAYYPDAQSAALMSKLSAAIAYLKRSHDFNGFDRAAFIIQYGNPITRDITRLEKRLNIHVIRYNRLLRQDAEILFDADAFDVDAYAPDAASASSPEKVALGKALFADPTLSGTGTRSCRSCHQPEKAFADGLTKNTIIGTKQPLKRNTPTLLNAALQEAQFDDMRATTLEDQVSNVVHNPDEMHGSLHAAAHKLWQNKKYQQLFARAFPGKSRNSIDTMEVRNALGSYVRSLTFMNSRFDQYMQGKHTTMNKNELHGFNLFMGKAKCGTCHYMPLFNGNFAPRYMKMESEVIGVPKSAASHVLDGDQGRYSTMQTPSFQHAFKVTTVRNISRTAPYMHNGAFANLNQVMDFYNKGGGKGMGMKLGNQTLPFDKLNLTAKETQDVIAFMKSLDSKY